MWTDLDVTTKAAAAAVVLVAIIALGQILLSLVT